jgi:hypothetical protein
MMHVIVIDPHPGATRNKEELNFSPVAMPLAATDRPIRDMHLTTRHMLGDW